MTRCDLTRVDERDRVIYLKQLKAQVAHDEYVVDPQLVAEAMLRRAAERRAGVPSVTRRGARGPAGAAPTRRPTA